MKRLLAWLVVGLLLAAGGFWLYARQPAIAEVAAPAPASFDVAQVAHGKALASAGNCAACHTAPGGTPYAGGYAVKTGFGTIYSTNITPDPETGIGGWSREAFRRALHEGVARDGSHLFPAFPYDHFTRLTDADVDALYAYFMSLQPVRAEAPKNSLPFPLNIRALQAGWKTLFFRPGRYQPDPAKGAEWNRGAYLAEGIAHCGACHTPRGALGAEKRGEAYAGTGIDNWYAPALTAANPAPLPWTKEALATFLSHGFSAEHGVAAGPMGSVPRDLSALPHADVLAVAAYFADLNGSAAKSVDAAPILAKALATGRAAGAPGYTGTARLYAAACASCRYNGADRVNALRPELALNSALLLDDPANLIQVILHGVNSADGIPGVVMPGYAHLSDAEVARLAGWLRATRTDKAPWTDLEKRVAEIRAAGA